MNTYDNLIITRIDPPFVVQSEKGHQKQIQNRHVFGLSLCMSGQIRYTLNGTCSISHPGTAVLLPQGGYYTLSTEASGLFPVINFTCTGLTGDRIVELPLENPQQCIREFEQLQRLFLRKESPMAIFSVFYSLLDKVLADKTRRNAIVNSAVSYIEQNISDPRLSNEILAAHLGISEVYLRKLFVADRETTPRQFLLDLRIRKAQQLLVDTPYSISVIAELCGFSSVYHFCRMFKNKTGFTPTQYAGKNRSFSI